MIRSTKEITPLFLRLIIKEKARSLSFGRDLATAILKSFVILLILIYLTGSGFYLEFILDDILKIEDIPAFLGKAAIFYLLAEFMARILLQKSPIIELGKFLYLPVKRSGIIHFLLGKSLLSVFSLIAICLFLPISLSQIGAAYGILTAIAWLGNLIILSISLHWIVSWLNKAVIQSLPGLLMVLLFAAIPFFLAYYDILNIGMYTGIFFAPSFSGFVQTGVSLGLCILSYRMVYSYYVDNAYLEQKKPVVPRLSLNKKAGLFAGFGEKGVLLDSELKLILRHKKSRNYLFLSPLFLGYFYLIFDPTDTFGNSAMLQLFFGLFVTGIFALNYGQFVFSWSSSFFEKPLKYYDTDLPKPLLMIQEGIIRKYFKGFFDFFMMKKNGLREMVRFKLQILNISCIILYLCSIPFLYYGWQIFAVLTAATLFNIGVGIPAVIFLSLWKPKPMDINKSAFFNYEGIGITQFLMILPYLVPPLVIYLPLSYQFGAVAALVAVGITGLTGLFFQRQVIDYAAQILHRNRHKIASTFRRGTL